MTDRFDVNGAAEYLGMSASFLNARRVKGGGPVFLKKGRLIEYRRADLDDWLESCRRKSTSQGEGEVATVSGLARQLSQGSVFGLRGDVDCEHGGREHLRWLEDVVEAVLGELAALPEPAASLIIASYRQGGEG